MSAWLFVPSVDEKKASKALASMADSVVLDLEDGVLPSLKEEGRRALRALLSVRPSSRARVFVRVNRTGTEDFFRDLESLKGLSFEGIMVPKAERVDSLDPLWSLGKKVVLLIETALGVESAPLLAKALPGLLERLALGYLDYIGDVGGSWTPSGEALIFPRSRVVLANRIGSLEPPLDGVYPDIEDLEGLKKECQTARILGFGGKMIIHPKHIDIVQKEFAPSQEEIKRAKGILEAFKKAKESGQGVGVYEGRFVDQPVVLWAERVLRGRGHLGES